MTRRQVSNVVSVIAALIALALGFLITSALMV